MTPMELTESILTALKALIHEEFGDGKFLPYKW